MGAVSIAPFAVVGPAAAGVGPKANAGRLTVETRGVTVLKKGASAFVKARNNQSVKAGDTVQTDVTGYAEILFPDGSVTRLDHSTVFAIHALATTKGTRQIEASVTTGRTWNRVQKLSESEGSTFRQRGGGATAAVLGTGFLTVCSPAPDTTLAVVTTKKALRQLQQAPQSCTFTLVDGKIELTTPEQVVEVNPGQQVQVVDGTAGEPEVIAPDILLADPWVTRNLAADANAGIVEPKVAPTPDDLLRASIEGAWSVTLTVTNPGDFRNLADPLIRAYSVASDCTSGECLLILTAQTANGTRVIPLTYTDGVYAGRDPGLGTQDCVLDDGTVAVPSGLANALTLTFTTTDAVDENGVWRATALSGTVTETAIQIAGDPDQCRAGTATFALIASR